MDEWVLILVDKVVKSRIATIANRLLGLSKKEAANHMAPTYGL